LSSSTCQSCKDQKVALELHRTHNFLTRLCDEFEPLRAQLLARHPCVSLMDTLVEVRNEETRLQDDGLLWVPSVLAARSSLVLLLPCHQPATHGASTGLHCDHCGRDGHMKDFCYRKKKAHKARRSSHGTSGSSSGRFEKSSAGLETQELLMLLHRLAASTPSGVVDSVTQSSVITGSAIVYQSSTL
jgi:hypothetical protein